MPTDDDLADQLVGFLTGDEAARCQLVPRLTPWLYRRAKVLAPPDFEARGLLDDVVSHTWELLLRRRPDAFDPARGGPIGYIASLLRTSVRDIRDLHRRAGGPVRHYEVDEPCQRPALESPPGAKRPAPDVLHDKVFSEMDSLLDLEASLNGFSGHLVAAVKRIGFEDMTMVTTARDVHATRFALKRQLSKWATAAELAVA